MAPKKIAFDQEAREAIRGGVLMCVNASSGKTVSSFELPSPPVFDGMAAAYGRIYLATRAGRVLCLTPKR